VKSVFVRLNNKKSLMVLESNPGQNFQNLFEAAKIAEQIYGNTWESVEYSDSMLTRYEFTRIRRHRVLRSYMNAILDDAFDKGMDFMEARDYLFTRMLG